MTYIIGPLNIDWTDLASVRALAQRCGPGTLVIKHKGRKNYNIVHKSRRDRWDKPNITVVYDTSQTYARA